MQDAFTVLCCNTELACAQDRLTNTIILDDVCTQLVVQTLTIILLCIKARVNRVRCPLLVRPRASTPFLLPPPQDTRAHPLGYRGST